MRIAPVIFAMLLAGCGGDGLGDLREFVEKSGADMRGKIEPPPEVKPYESFVYVNDMDLSSPFKPRKPDRDAGSASENQPDRDRPKEALEEFPLESLKMVGYLYRNGIGHAVIRAPDKKLHTVKLGDHIGMNYGEITQVNESEILIKETIQDGSGSWTRRDSSLLLLEVN